jgi:hypothetical protein
MPSAFYQLSLALALIFLTFAGSVQAQDGTVGLETTGADRDTQFLDEGVKFIPHWSGEAAFSRSSQPLAGGLGQTQTDLAFTATDNLDADGNYLALGASGGSQRVEGSQSAYGSLSASGGLVLGDFMPSLTLESQAGEAKLKTYSAILDLNFQLMANLTLGVLLGGGFQDHQGPAVDGTIDTKNWTGGLSLAYQAFDDLGFNVAVQRQTDITYEAATKTVDDEDRVNSLTLGFDWSFVKHLLLEGTAQYGREYYPGGSFYSPISGETLDNLGGAHQDFAGYSLALIWDFDFAGEKS